MKKMKNNASALVKRVMEVVKAIAKAKSLAIKSKGGELKTRLVMFSLTNTRKVLQGSISNKIHSILHHQHEDDHQSKAIVVYTNHNYVATPNETPACSMVEEDDDDDDKYPDLRHSLYDELLEEEGRGSVIDLVKNSKEDGGEDFRLEDEIDHVADLFIRRFHKQMRLQKLQSFKRFQEMLQRSA